MPGQISDLFSSEQPATRFESLALNIWFILARQALITSTVRSESSIFKKFKYWALPTQRPKKYSSHGSTQPSNPVPVPAWLMLLLISNYLVLEYFRNLSQWIWFQRSLRLPTKTPAIATATNSSNQRSGVPFLPTPANPGFYLSWIVFRRLLARSNVCWTIHYFCYFDLARKDFSLQIWMTAWFRSALNFLPRPLQLSKSN